jgi:hypothetical protein
VAQLYSYTTAERETTNNPRHHSHSFNMASTLTPEARELALVGKVEMRIALADSDKKLEDLLKLYLSPLLLKLGSDSVAVRNKVRNHLYFKPEMVALSLVTPLTADCFRSSPFANTSIHV